jgi:hypothetical protein
MKTALFILFVFIFPAASLLYVTGNLGPFIEAVLAFVGWV